MGRHAFHGWHFLQWNLQLAVRILEEGSRLHPDIDVAMLICPVFAWQPCSFFVSSTCKDPRMAR